MDTAILFLISGAFSAGFAVITELVLLPGKDALSVPGEGSVLPFALIFGLFMIAVIEESIKLLVLERQSRNRPDGPIRSTALPFGLGFAAAESALAAFSAQGSDITASAVAGLFLLHTGTSLLYGTSIRRGRNTLITVLLIGVALHFVYDILLALA
ncbi:MAG: hypothetical protein HGA38_02995 [Candidatus Moranbacteria bacterium]|nr:hypothetical protein [Candidatus Moranbacteria bacterium]